MQSESVNTAKAPLSADILKKPLAEIDPSDPVLLQDPYEYYRRLREEAPVFRDPRTGVVYVSSYELVLEVLQHPQIFSSNTSSITRGADSMDPAEAEVVARGIPHVDILSTADQPLHTEQRMLVMKAFTPARIKQTEGRIAEITHMLIDQLIGRGRCDFKQAFACRLPAIVMSDMLGVPRENLDRYLSWSDATVAQIAGDVASPAVRLDAARKKLEFQEYFMRFIAERRQRATGDLVSDLIRANLSDQGSGRGLTDVELVNLIEQLNIAGNETTANTLTAGIYYLITRKELRAQVELKPTLIETFIEELLRFYSPVAKMPRVVAQDSKLGGVSLLKGDVVFVGYASANRDPAKFDHPDEFDLGRNNPRRHVAFASGIHSCLGAHLARREMTVAFPILLDRLKNLRLAAPGETLRLNPHPLLTSPVGLDISFDPA